MGAPALPLCRGVATAVILALIATACTSAAAAEVSVTVDDSAATVSLGDQVTVEVPAGAVPAGTTVTIRRVDPPDLPSAFELASDVYDITASAQLVAPVTITLADGDADNEIPAMVGWLDDGWELLDSQPDPQAGTVSATVDHLSRFATLRVSGDGLIDWLEKVERKIARTPEPEPPTCDGPQPRLTIDGLDEWACAEVADDGQLHVTIVNEHKYSIDVTLPDGARLHDADYPNVGVLMTDTVDDWLRGRDFGWIPASGSATYALPYDPDVAGELDFRLSGSENGAALMFVVYLLDVVFGAAGEDSLLALSAQGAKKALDCAWETGLSDGVLPLLRDMARCGGWQLLLALFNPAALVLAASAAATRNLDRVFGDLARGYEWGAIVTVGWTPPLPDLDAVDVGALVDDDQTVVEVGNVELTGTAPKELVVVTRHDWFFDGRDDPLQISGMHVYSWVEGDWRRVLDTATWPTADDPLVPSMRDVTTPEPFATLDSVEPVDFAGDGAAELALATQWTGASSGPLTVTIVSFDADAQPTLTLDEIGGDDHGRGGAIRAHHDRLVVERPYVHLSALCCPTGWTEYTVGWDGSRIAVLSQDRHVIELRGDGLGIVGFGDSQAHVLEVLERILGEADYVSADDPIADEFNCHNARWGEHTLNLSLRFDVDGRFFSYNTLDGGFDSPHGLRPGFPVPDFSDVGTVVRGGFDRYDVIDGPAEGMSFVTLGEQAEPPTGKVFQVGAGPAVCD